METIKVNSNVYYSITTKNGLALEIADFNCASGAPVQLWENAKGDSQTWLLSEVAHGYFKIENKLSGKVLDVSLGAEANGTQLHVWDYLG
ncbi:MAG: RICIN domain-containing protein, partial [Oscillospiraceae bacterium]